MANILYFLLPFLPAALAALPLFGLWPCACLCFWLLRHRGVKLPLYRRAIGALLVEETSAIKPHPRAKPEWVRRKVLYLATHQDSCRSIACTFNRWHGRGHGNETIGKSWVAEFIKQHADEIAEARRAMRRKPPPWFAVNHTWALDLTFPTCPDGFTFTVLGIIDHGSRRLLCLKSLPRKCTFTLLANVFLAIAEFGLPCAIRTDNESMFTSQLWGCTLKALGILHRRGPPGQPWRNGRIERLFGTLKPILRKVKPTTTLALQKALSEFSRFYNQIRPHQNLGGLTPVEAWQGKTLADVQDVHSQTESQGQWIYALDALMVGYGLRC
jgi:putative transposase